MILQTFILNCKLLLCFILVTSSVKQRNSVLETWWRTLQTSYPRYNETTALLQDLQHNFPNTVQVYSIGRSVEGRELWVIKLGANVNSTSGRPILRPMVKIVANMHGDEALGRQITLLLAVFLLRKYTAEAPRITRLLNSVEVHLLPSMNPDGYEVSREGNCRPNPRKKGRMNANLVDLNRNFPSWSYKIPSIDSKSTASVRQPETLSVIKWIRKRAFVLSASLHGGALVTAYPYNAVTPNMSRDFAIWLPLRGVANPSEDDKFFKFVSKIFADSHRTMSVGNKNTTCGLHFQDGIVNGAEWYHVVGGMMDYVYLKTNCLEITMELSCCKFPKAENIKEEWQNNREAFLKFFEAATFGVKGLVLDNNGNPVSNASIEIEGIDHPVKSTKRGEYWRLLAPGSYNMRARASGYAVSDWTPLTVLDSTTQLVNFTLWPANY